MYITTSAIVKSRGFSGRWETLDLSNTVLNTLWVTYARIYLILTNQYSPVDLCLDMSLVVDEMTKVNPNLTVSQWLNGLGNASLPTTTVIPKLEFGHVRYRDAIAAGYKHDLLHRSVHPSVPIPSGTKQDVSLVKHGIDYSEFEKYCLTTINGFFHRCVGNADNVQILDAGTSLQFGNDNHVGILSFLDIGELDIIPITTSMVSSATPAGTLGNSVNLKIPEEHEVGDKTILVSIGGYLHYVGKLIKYVGNGILQVDIGNFGLESRFYDMQNKIDISSMTQHLPKKNGSFNQVALSELYADPVILALLTLSQSFIVLVDNTDIFIEHEELEQTFTPGLYLTRTKPDYPVVFNKGSLYSYWAIAEEDVWTISGKTNERPNYNHETSQVHQQLSIDNTRNTINPTDWSRAYFLKISALKTA